MTNGRCPLPKKERLYNNGNWTLGRWNSFVTSILRSGSRRWPPKYETLNGAKTEKKINAKTGRLAQHYRCNACQEEFTAKGVEVDHHPHIGPGLDWNEFINRLFCEADGLQVLCKPCHKIKSAKEKKK